MRQGTNLLLLIVLAGSSHAVFYTKSTSSEYPRIGRRSFYTSGTGYPRIGRRSGPGTGDGQLLSPSEFMPFEKRGLYTNLSGGYPRVGRSGASTAKDIWQQTRSKLLQNIAALDGNVEDVEETSGGLAGGEGGSSSPALQGNSYGLDLLFLAFDENDDNQLSKAEFTRGMEKYRQRNPLC